MKISLALLKIGWELARLEPMIAAFMCNAGTTDSTVQVNNVFFFYYNIYSECIFDQLNLLPSG